MRIFSVRLVGWACVDDEEYAGQPEGIIAGPKRSEALALAKQRAVTSARRGTDAQVEVYDKQDRKVRIIPFFADKYAQGELEEVRAAKEAARA